MDLIVLCRQWLGKEGYLLLLHRLNAEPEETYRDFMIMDYLARQLGQRKEAPIWSQTLTPGVLERLDKDQPDGFAGRFWVFEAVLNSAQFPSETRNFIWALFHNDPQLPVNAREIQLLEQRIRNDRPSDEVTQGWTKIILAAARMWAALNSRIAEKAQEREPYLRKIWETFERLVSRADPERYRRIQAERRYILLSASLRAHLAHHTEDEESFRNEIADILRDDPKLVYEFSTLLAEIASENPDLASACRKLATAFGVQNRFLGLEQHRELVQQTISLVKRISDGIAATTQRAWTDRERDQVEFIALRALDIHKLKYRKDDKTPVFVHQLAVVAKGWDDFHLTSPLAYQILFLHDTQEDQAPEYKKLMEQIDPWLGPPEDEERIALVRLGVRMMTYLEGFSRDVQEKKCYEGLINPKAVYGDMPEFAKAFEILEKYPRKERELRRICQIGKAADRMSGWESYAYFYDDTLARANPKKRAELEELPAKIYRKTLLSLNPHLINARQTKETGIGPLAKPGTDGCLLTFREAEIYYGKLMDVVKTFAAIDLTQYPLAVPLKQAASEAMAGLRQNIRDNIFHWRPYMKQLAAEPPADSDPDQPSGPSPSGTSPSAKTDPSAPDNLHSAEAASPSHTILRLAAAA